MQTLKSMICAETHIILSYLTATFLDFFIFNRKLKYRVNLITIEVKKNTLQKGRKWHWWVRISVHEKLCNSVNRNKKGDGRFCSVDIPKLSALFGQLWTDHKTSELLTQEQMTLDQSSLQMNRSVWFVKLI